MAFPDIPYAQIDGVDPNLLSLDIYSPLTGGPNTPRPVGVFPVVVYFHGGSWRTGDKRDATVPGVKSPYFTSQGVIFVSVNYRLAPLVKHPAQVEDVAAAVAWVHMYIDYYGGDTRQIYVMGHSAGGQLAALVATDERYLAAHGLKLDSIHGVILLDGVGLDIPAMITPSTLSMFETAFGSDPTVWREASPLYHISSGKGIPPFLMFYAVENGKGLATSQEMAQALTAAGVDNELVAAEGRNHATIVDAIGTPGDPVSARIMEFLNAMKP
jgi:arylformamidase